MSLERRGGPSLNSAGLLCVSASEIDFRSHVPAHFLLMPVGKILETLELLISRATKPRKILILKRLRAKYCFQRA